MCRKRPAHFVTAHRAGLGRTPLPPSSCSPTRLEVAHQAMGRVPLLPPDDAALGPTREFGLVADEDVGEPQVVGLEGDFDELLAGVVQALAAHLQAALARLADGV